MSEERTPERYSRITRRMWGDQRFRALSAPTANARDLWVYLLTGSHCSRVPGLFVLGPLAMAERLGWAVEDTRRCFQEIVDQGLALWDPDSLLCWLPNAVKHNEPANPNVVLGWAEEWRGLPECRLLDKARAGIRRTLEAISPAFAAAFDKVAGKPSRRAPRKASGKACRKGSGKPSGKGSGKQEQDPDPDQEQEPKIPPSDVDPAPATQRARACDGTAESGGAEEVISGERGGRPHDARSEPNAEPPSALEAQRGVAVGAKAATPAAAAPPLDPPAALTASTNRRTPARAPGSEPAATALVERVLAALRSAGARAGHNQGPLACIATAELATRLAGMAGPAPLLELPDLLHAIQETAAALSVEAREQPPDRDGGAMGPASIAKFLSCRVMAARRGDAARAAARPRGGEPPSMDAESDEVSRFLVRFDQRWSQANGGRVRAVGPRDRTNAARIVASAREQAPRAGPNVTSAHVLDHWTTCIVRDLRREAIVDPLACLLARIGGYGLPLPPQEPEPAGTGKPRMTADARPEEVAAITKGLQPRPGLVRGTWLQPAKEAAG
jgi:hypothetical protein